MKEIAQTKIYSGAWITLAATAASVAFSLDPLISVFLSLIALIVGYRSLRVIHKHPELFSGSGIVIPALVVSVLVFLITAAVLGFSLLWPTQKEVAERQNITITTDEDAIAFADELRAGLAEHKPELAQPFDGALVMTLDWDEMNALGLSNPEWFAGNETFYLVSWEAASGSLVKLCSTAFTPTGDVALEPSCAVTEVVIESEEEEEMTAP